MENLQILKFIQTKKYVTNFHQRQKLKLVLRETKTISEWLLRQHSHLVKTISQKQSTFLIARYAMIQNQTNDSLRSLSYL